MSARSKRSRRVERETRTSEGFSIRKPSLGQPVISLTMSDGYRLQPRQMDHILDYFDRG